MEKEPIHSTETISEYAIQGSVKFQSTLYKETTKEPQDVNFVPKTEQPYIRDAPISELENSRRKRFSSFSEDSKEQLSPIDSDDEEDEEDLQDDPYSFTIKKGIKYFRN